MHIQLDAHPSMTKQQQQQQIQHEQLLDNVHDAAPQERKLSNSMPAPLLPLVPWTGPAVLCLGFHRVVFSTALHAQTFETSPVHCTEGRCLKNSPRKAKSLEDALQTI